MSKSTYLAYVSGGVCRDTHAPTKDADGNPVKVGMIRKQFWVAEEMRRIGIDAWCGRKVDFRRLGKQRDWTRIDTPALPNYLILTMEPQRMFDAISVEHVAPTMTLVAGAALYGTPASKGGEGKFATPAKQGLLQFQAAVERDFRAAEKVDANSRAEVTEYKAGQKLRVVDGPMQDLIVTFERLVKAPHYRWQRVAGRTEAGVPIELDPLDVRGA